jgi:hypothetical protein
LAARKISFKEFKKSTDKNGKSLYNSDGTLIDPKKGPYADESLYCDDWFFNYALQ